MHRADALHAMVDCFNSMLRLQNVGHHQLPQEYRKLLTFDESPAAMSTWMAINLSAPTIQSKGALPEPATRRDNVQVVRSNKGLPFGRLKRPKLHFYKNSNTSASTQVAFQADGLHISTLKMLSIPYLERANANVSSITYFPSLHPPPFKPYSIQLTRVSGIQGDREVILKTTEALTPPEVDMIVVMDALNRLHLPRTWTINDSPILSLSKEENLRRLLMEWTTLEPREVADTIKAPTFRQGSEPSGDPLHFDNGSESESDSDSDSDGGASTEINLGGVPDGNKPRFAIWEEPQNKNSEPLLLDNHSRLAGRFNRVGSLQDQPSRSTIPSTGTHATQYPRAWPTNSWQQRPPSPANRFSSRRRYHPEAYPAPAPTTKVWRSVKPIAQPPRRAPSPPPPAMRYGKRDKYLETIGDDTGDRHRPNSPSMLDSPTPGAHDSSLEQRGIFRGDLVTSSKVKPERRQSGVRQDTANYDRKDGSQEDIQALVWEQVEQDYWAKKATELPDDRNSHGDNSRRPGKGHVPIDHMRQQGLETIYQDMLEKAYADLKRKEAHDREIIEIAKGEIRDETRVKDEDTEKRIHKTLEELKQDVERLVAAAHERDTDETIDLTSLVDPWDHIDYQHKYPPPNQYVDSVEVFSFLDKDDGAETSSSSSSSDTSPDDGEGRETSGTTPENDEKLSIESKSNVERSQLWRGAAHVSGSFEFEPLYLRGSDAGQTWYLGDDPVYIIEFQEGYEMDVAAATKTTIGDTPGNSNSYLLVGHLWIETEALDKFGLKYKECAAEGYYLDPSLTSHDIQALVDFSFALREIGVFRKFEATPSSLFPCPPPAGDEFGNKDAAPHALTHSPHTTPLNDGISGSKIEAVKKARRSQTCASVGAVALFTLSVIYCLRLYQ